MTFDFDGREVVPFPANRMTGRLRSTAASIRVRPRDKWSWHFRRECNRIFDEARSAGVSFEAARRQGRAFAVALECEIRRQIVLEALYQQEAG